MIHHPIRFAYGLFLIAGWLTGTEIITYHVLWYPLVTLGLFMGWIAFEEVIDVLEYGYTRFIPALNILGIIALDVMTYLTVSGFPVRTSNSPLVTAGLIYIVLYLILGIVINIDKKIF